MNAHGATAAHATSTDVSVKLSPTFRLTQTFEMLHKILCKLGMFPSIWSKWINQLLQHQKAHPAEDEVGAVSPWYVLSQLLLVAQFNTGH